jgi:hypothetical protein
MSELSVSSGKKYLKKRTYLCRGSPDWLVFVEDTDTHQKERPRSIG